MKVRVCLSYTAYFIVISNKRKTSPSPPAPLPRKNKPTNPSSKVSKNSTRKIKQFQHLERFRTWFRYSRPGGKLRVCDVCFQSLADSTGMFCSGSSEEPGRWSLKTGLVCAWDSAGKGWKTKIRHEQNQTAANCFDQDWNNKVTFCLWLYQRFSSDQEWGSERNLLMISCFKRSLCKAVLEYAKWLHCRWS